LTSFAATGAIAGATARELGRQGAQLYLSSRDGRRLPYAHPREE